jgi:hypothetical protein
MLKLKSRPYVPMNTIPPELLPAFCANPLSWLALSLTCKDMRAVENPFVCDGGDGDDGVYAFTSAWYSFEIQLEFYSMFILTCSNGYRAVDEYSPKYILVTPNFDGYISYFNELPSIFPIAPPGYRWFRRSVLNEEYDCVDVWRDDVEADAVDAIATGHMSSYLFMGNRKTLERQRVKALYDIIGPPHPIGGV